MISEKKKHREKTKNKTFVLVCPFLNVHDSSVCLKQVVYLNIPVVHEKFQQCGKGRKNMMVPKFVCFQTTFPIGYLNHIGDVSKKNLERMANFLTPPPKD
jgi:hypothetical protein